jgi:uncharacterized delta-60 repeat protein
VRRLSIVLAVAALVGLLATPAAAVPGKLDKTFSGDGKQTTFPKGGTGYAVAIDKQGRIVVAGYTLTANTNIAVARFLANGKPDTSFSSDGRVTTDLGGTDYAFDVAVQGDGRIVVAGERDYANRSQFAVVRYGGQGKLDKSFSGDGKNFTDFGKKYQGANALVIGPSGNILLGGFTSNGSLSRWAMARYKQDGSLDPTFGNKGKVSRDLSPTDEQIQDLVLAKDGRIVAAGYAEASLTPRFAIAQFRTGGKLDQTFGTKGSTLVNVSSGGDIAYGLARQKGGGLVMAGYADNGGKSDWGLTRVGPKGHVDKAFGNKGKVITGFGPNYDYAYGVAVQANGRIVVVGRASRNGADFGVVRYRPGGALDKTFGNNGKTLTSFFGDDDTARGVVIQPNGKIVVAGEAKDKARRRMAVARYQAA